MHRRSSSYIIVALVFALSFSGCIGQQDEEEPPTYAFGTTGSVGAVDITLVAATQGHFENAWGGFYDENHLALTYTITNNKSSTIAIDPVAESTLKGAGTALKSIPAYMFDQGTVGNITAAETVQYIEYYEWPDDAAEGTYTVEIKKAKFIAPDVTGAVRFTFSTDDIAQNDSWKYIESMKQHPVGEPIVFEGITILLEQAAIEHSENVTYVVLELALTNTLNESRSYSKTYADYGNTLNNGDGTLYASAMVADSRSYTENTIPAGATITTAVFFRMVDAPSAPDTYLAKLNSEFFGIAGVTVQFTFTA